MNIRGGDRVMALIRDSKMRVKNIAIDKDDQITSIAFHGCTATVCRIVTDSSEEWQIHDADEDGNEGPVSDVDLLERVQALRREAEGFVRKVNVLRDEAAVIEKMMALVKAV